MIFRRRSRGNHLDDDHTDDDHTNDDHTDEAADSADEAVEGPMDRPLGPWDRSETTADEADENYLDLGGLLVKGGLDVEVRLQVDETTSEVEAVMLASADSGLELRAFAAPRSAGIWDDVRADIAAEAARHGGTVTEQEGEFGPELAVVMPVQTPEGRQASQPSRIVGVDGPRWMLRGTFFGRSALAPDPEGDVETAFRAVVVVRGDGPMAPRELLTLRIPPQISLQPESGPDL